MANQFGEERSSALYQGVGYTLRSARQRAGLDLRAVSGQLRIRFPHLKAMEEGRFDELPGRIYAIGFLRTYAEFLQLDTDAVVEAFKVETAAQPPHGRLVFPVPAPETRTPRGWLILLALIIAGALYGAWYYNQERGRVATEAVAPPPPPAAEAPNRSSEPPPAGPAANETPQPQRPAESPTTQPAVGNASPLAGTPPSTPATAPGNAPPATSAPMPTMEPTAANAPAAAPAQPSPPNSPADGPQVYGSTDSNVRVVLKARTDSWIEVRGAGNELVFPGHVLHEGETYRVPNRSDVVLWSGNLGGLDITVDGKPVPRLGAQGEAKRNISLDPKNLLAGGR
ncbi:MAG TPA: RodZ domain-containing protein [Candidatus Cybelea sp.]|nr:RodZ domain-containing protein [Candidatus Cybelea sp.]